jgi:DNA polymerase
VGPCGCGQRSRSIDLSGGVQFPDFPDFYLSSDKDLFGAQLARLNGKNLLLMIHPMENSAQSSPDDSQQPSHQHAHQGGTHQHGACLESWTGFLPPGAIVMAKVSKPELELLDPLEQISLDLVNCTRCKLCQQRSHIVVGDGNPHAELVFIGEGPGEQEDIEGLPFVGKAGQLLTRMIQAIGLQREQVYITNVVKCRPPGNRNPEPDEIQACSPFLYRQLDAIQPKMIVALGKFAVQTLLGREVKITQMRGQLQTYRGIKLMPTYHPSYLLRNPSAKKEVWMDLQQVAKELNLSIPKR